MSFSFVKTQNDQPHFYFFSYFVPLIYNCIQNISASSFFSMRPVFLNLTCTVQVPPQLHLPVDPNTAEKNRAEKISLFETLQQQTQPQLFYLSQLHSKGFLQGLSRPNQNCAVRLQRQLAPASLPSASHPIHFDHPCSN